MADQRRGEANSQQGRISCPEALQGFKKERRLALMQFCMHCNGSVNKPTGVLVLFQQAGPELTPNSCKDPVGKRPER